MVYFESNLIGHAFYIKRKGEKTEDIIWILQLVVAKQFRGNGIGSKLLHSIWGLSDCYAWGLFTPKPRAEGSSPSAPATNKSLKMA